MLYSPPLYIFSSSFISAGLKVSDNDHLYHPFLANSLIIDMEAPPDTPETDERCRSIERGSRLVTVMPSAFAVVLQAPRGNIETIYPRALVLAGIRSFIDKKDYRSAFLTCRSQMVDMNLIHDYAPEQFMESITLFVDQVKRVDFVDEFLSRLKYVILKCS
jgi:elongator complex protein 1